MDARITSLIQDLHSEFKSNNEGKLASYIPELANVDPSLFAISVVSVDGEKKSVGDFNKSFTLQSTSKPFVYGLALEKLGRDFVHSKVGVEPTGEAFNSIIELEEKSHRPFNPMINSGAIATVSMIPGNGFDDKLKDLKKLFQDYVGHSLSIDEKVFESEKKTAHRNRAISYLMKHFGVMDSDVEETLDLYFKQCSILVDCEDLAMMAATLANDGVQPLTGQRIVSSQSVSDMLSLMFTCGMYDSAGDWAFRVGLPAKSGVSGALLAVVPGRFGIAAYSPLIDEKGHSVRSSLAICKMAKLLNLNIFKLGQKN